MKPRLTLALRRAFGVGLAVLGLSLSARITLTLTESSAPLSLQSLAVLLTGAALGARHGVIAIAWYLVLGAAGLPVFANGAAGASHLVGPTAGFLLGFLPAVVLMGRATEAGPRGAWPRFGLAVLGAGLGAHALILACGWGRLALLIGPEPAWVKGVAPFIGGALIKSAFASVLIGAAWYALNRRPRPTPAR